MIVSANTNDVFEYVIGLSPYDALERSLDQTVRKRYEFFDAFIYDFTEGKMYPQSQEYRKYMMEVSKLKSWVTKKHMGQEEILRVSEEIAEIAPNHINLDYTDEDIK